VTEEEDARGQVLVKDMKTGEQQAVKTAGAIDAIRSALALT